MSSLPFPELPHQSRLFIEYQRDPVSLNKFYPNAVASCDRIPEFIPEVLANCRTDRAALCEALIEFNGEIRSGVKTFENIELLREPDTVAVVTGQQAGLFTGPLFTIYKALSAIKMAEFLNANGAKAVPVFWAANEDHDIDEVSQAYFIGNAGELGRAENRPGMYVKNSPVGRIKLDGSIHETIDKIFAQISHTELSAEVRGSIEKAWSEGTLFGTAFAKNLAGILADYGLIYIDPMNERLKALAAPVYVEAIEKTAEIVAGIRQRSSELVNEGYHAQVLVEDDYFPLFWHTDGGQRTALRKVGNNLYGAKDEKCEFTLSELAAIGKDDPGRFSPGVMLRPVVQDYLLPTACYFGGAAEIAYFAQNSEAYRILGRPVTPILHRQSFTVVEAKHRRTLEKFGLEFSDMFEGIDATLESIGKRHLSPETAKIFAEVEETINAELNRLDQNLSPIDPTLATNLATRRRKIIYHIGALKKKAYLAQVRKDETVDRQIRAAFTALLPKGQLQERVLNVNSFLNKYGPYFIDWIYEAIELKDKDHRIIYL